MSVDTFNKYMVGVGQGGIVILNPPSRSGMSKEEALVLAAWLVMMADHSIDHEEFRDILAELGS